MIEPMIEPGSRLSNYLVEALVGEGGFCRVYRAIQGGPEGFNRPVAIKVLRHLPGHASSVRRAFSREARVVGRLQHRNIVQIYEFLEVDERLLLVMEFVDGLTLQRLVTATEAKIPARLAVGIGLDLCRALHYAHHVTDERNQPVGIVHRDVKPANVLINRQGEVKLSDFGLAKMSLIGAESFTVGRAVKGTPGYMSPEQEEGLAATAAADVFALARMIYALLGARLSKRLVFDKQGSPSVPALPLRKDSDLGELQRLLRAAMHQHPEHRPGTDELIAGLERALAQLTPPAQITSLPDELSRLVTRVLSKSTQAAGPGAQTKQPIGQQPAVFAPRVVADPSSTPPTTETSDPVSATLPPTEPDAGTASAPSSEAKAVVRRRSPLLLGLAALLLLGLAAVALLTRRTDQPATESDQGTSRGSIAPPMTSALDAALPRTDGRVGSHAATMRDAGDRVDVTTRIAPIARGKPPHRRRDRQRPRPPRHGDSSTRSSGTGALSVNATPWATVFVDGKPIGTTPLFKVPLAAGRHRLRLVRGDGSRTERTITVRAGEVLNLGNITTP